MSHSPSSGRGHITKRNNSKRPCSAPKRRRIFLEQLEERSLMAVMTWDGSANALWSNPANWVGDVAPTAGDDLVFPGGAAFLANTNDLPVNTRFNTILIQGSGYNITGAAIELAGGLTANNVTGSNTFDLDTTVTNAQSIISANPGTTLNFSGDINTANIIGSYFIGSLPAIVFDGSGDITASGVISGAGGISKMGFGTTTLSGANTFEGIAEARQGFLRVTSNTGLGSATTAHTEVQAGAALELSGVTIAEHIAIREGGVGFGNGTDISSAGALRGVGGTTSTITGNVEMIGGNNLIGVTAGSTLNISGQVMAGISTGAGRRLLKVGPGTLQFTGSQPNIYPGDTVVLQGRLELGKTGVNAIPGNLIIGDNIGGDNAAEVRLLGSNQIAQLTLFETVINTITLASSGVLNFNGNSDVIGNLTLTTGNTYSSDVSTGAGTLTLGGNLTLSTFQGSSGVTPAATISGNLDLGTFFSGGAAGSGQGTSRTINVGDTQLQHIGTDLSISANITGTSDVAITQTGAGTLRLSGNNSGWAGQYIMQGGGVLEIGSNTALGSGLVSLQNNGNVVRPVGASRSIANPISLDGNVTFLGDDGTVGVENLTFSGPVTLTGGRTLLTMDPTQNVTISGVIDEGIFASQSFAKSGRGTLTLTGANTFSGTTTVNTDGGTLVLSGNGSLLNNNGLTVNIGGSLVLDNTGTVNNNRIDDSRSISLQGRLALRGNAGANVQEVVGPIDPVQNTAPIIEVENVSGGAFSSVLVGSSLTVGGDRPTRFIGTGLPLSETGQNRLEFTFNPGGLDDAILPQGVVFGPGGAIDFATFGSGVNGTAIIPLPASAYVTDIAQASVTSNVRLTGANVLAGNKQVNAILFNDGATLTGPSGSILTVAAGNFLFAGDGALTVPNASVGNGLFFVDAGHTATVSSNIFSGTIQKNGFGKLIISGDNQHTGNTLANEGVLNIQRSSAVGSPAAGTFARVNASIELEQTSFGPVVVGLEPLTLEGTGGLTNPGALRNVAGNNSWAGTVSLNASPAVSLLAETGGFPLVNIGAPFLRTEAGTTFTITGDTGNASDFAKTGPGTLELAGIIPRGQDRNNRVLEGTMLLNNEPGIQASRGRYFIGSNAPGAPAATVRLGGSDQIIDDRGVTVFGSGLFDLNGKNELIGEGLTTHISVAGGGDVNIGTGGTLTVNANTNVFTQGTGNAAGSTITGGTFALHVFGVIGAASSRSWQINDGAVGNDLTITSAIVDGSGAQIMGLNKNGFGQMEIGGTTPNTYTGDTVVNEGVLILNKGTGTGGVDALAGRIFVGDNSVQSGFSGSDILRLAQPNQIPDFLAPIDLRTTGRWELNGNNETIGQMDAQNALTLRASSSVDLGGATLTVNGNINTNSAEGAGLWTPVVGTRILGGTLALGNLQRVIDNPDRAELPYEMEISSNITGTGGFVTSSTGTLLLNGDNSGLSGDIVRNNGNFAIGSDTAFGTGRAVLNGSITTYGGKRTIATEILFGANVIGLIGGNNTAGVGAIGGGGNDLKFTGPVNVTPGTWQPSVPVAGQVEFAGQIGETLGGVTLRKIGFGTVILSNIVTLSGTIEVGQDFGGGPGTRLNGGTVIIRDQATVLNMGFLIGTNGVLQIDNSGMNLPNRIGDTALVDIFGGTLALVGKPGEISGESLGQLRPRNEFDGAIQSLVSSAPGTQATWRFTSLARETNGGQGSALRVSGRGTDITPTGSNRIALNTSAGLLVDGIVPYAVLSGSTGLDFLTATNAAPTLTPYDNFLGALTSGANFSTSLAGATGTVNVKLAANEVIGGSITANALLMPGGLVVSGAGTLILDSGLLVATGTNTVSVANLTLGGAEGLVFVDGKTSDLTLTSGITAAGSTSAFAKAGLGTVVVGGGTANLFTGTTRVVNGIYRANKDSAFGTTAGNVRVTYGATIELNGVLVPAEQIDINGNGEANAGNVPLRTVPGSGLSTWNGTVSVNINRSAVEVNTGSTLVMAGAVNNQGMNKTGAGTLQFSGAAANGFVQDNQNLTIWQGTVELNKTAGTNAMSAAGTNRSIVVGDNVGGPNSDRLVFLQSNQIPDTNNLTVTSTGQVDYGANTEIINLFSLQAGLIASGTITGSTGSLQINSNSSIDGLSNSGAGGTAGPATIAGTLVLGGTAPRIITVNDTVALTDLNMPAVLGAASVNFQKDGAGRLALSGNSSAYAGSITLNGGETIVQNANAFGTGAGNTTVNNGFTLMLDGVSLAEPLTLTGAGFGGVGAIRNISGNNTLTGTITLAGTSTIGVNAGQMLDVNAQITGAGQGVTKLLPGTLRYSGGTANNYTGTTTVVEGVLELNKTAGTDAIAGVLTIGNDAGVQNADLVRLLASDQINNGVQVQVTPSGHLDLNNSSETLGNAVQTGLNFFLGVTTAPRISTGTGTLTLAAGVGIQTQLSGGIAASTTSTPGATITGNLNLANGTHNLNAADAGFNIRELQLDATISGGGASGVLTTSGSGLVYITGNNVGLTGTNILNGGGGFVIGNNNALGSGPLTVNTAANIFTAGYGAAAGSTTFTLPNAINLNADLTIRGDQNLALNGLVSGLGAANRTVTLNTHNNASFVIGAPGISLSNDGTARTFTLTNNTYNHTAATINGPIVNGAGAANHAFQKGGVGWLTLTNNANTYAGVTTVAAGLLQITAAGALGTNGSLTTNHTVVNNGASLIVAAGLTVPEWLVLNNNGFGNFGSLRMLDAVPGTTETATISGNVNFNTTSFVGVDGGGANPDRLIFNGTLASGGGQMNKVGFGEMEVTGASDNGVAFTGAPSPWDDGLLVRQGSLIFNKTGALRVISGGTITVGDGGGGNNWARLNLIGSGTDQIGGNLNVDVGANGQLNFAGATTSESIAQLQVFRLGRAAGSVDTTGAGTLTLNGQIFASNAGLTTSATPAAQIAGNINVNGARNVNASDSFVLNPADDLIVSAVLSNGSINVDGDGGRSGTVVLTGNNTFAGGTTVTGQTIDFNQSFTNGLNVFVDGTLVVRGAGTLGTGGVSVSGGATLLLDNTGGVVNRIADAAAVNVNGGTLTLRGNSVTPMTEQIGALTINAANGTGTDSTIRIDDEGQITELLAASLGRGAGALVHFVGVDSNLQNDSNARIQITALPATSIFDATNATDGIMPWATLSGPAGYDLVTDGDTTDNAGPIFIERFTGDGNTYDTDINALTHGVVKLTAATAVLSAARTVRALWLESTGIPGGVNLNGNVLTVGTTAPGLVLSRGAITNVIFNTGAAVGVDFGGREPLFAVEAPLNVSVALNGSGALRKERLETLTLSADSDNGAGQTFTGSFTVNAGTVVASNSDALGNESGGAGEVTVNRRGALVLDATVAGLSLGNTGLNVSGLGFNDNGTGALRTLGTGGVDLGTGITPVNWNASPTIVDINNGNILRLFATVGGGGNTLTKNGSGALAYNGTAANTNTGTVSVNEGTLALEKTGTNLALGGSVTVNDLSNYDSAGLGRVLYILGSSTNMIADGATVTVNANGQFDMGAFSDTISVINLNGGTISTGTGTLTATGASTITGGSFTGNLILNNNLTYNSGLATNGPATINGTLGLGGAQRTYAVNDGYFSTNDLTINAAISNGRIVKSGAGSLLLSNSNTFLGDLNEIQTITIPATVTSVNFSLNAFGANLTTVNIPFSASTPASVIQAALERLSNIQPGNISVSGVAGGPYTVTFQGALQGIDFGQLTSTVVTGSGTITHATTQNGVSGFHHSGGLVSVSNNAAFGGARVAVTTSGALIPVGNRTIPNAFTIFPNTTYTLGGRRDFTGNSSLTLSGPVSLGTPATAQDINFNVDDPLTTAIISGAIDGGNSTGFLRLQKTGQGTLQMTGANSYLAPLNIAAGILRIGNNTGLGAVTNELVFVQDTGAAFTLTFNGFTTTSIPTGSLASTVAAALNALPSIGGVNGSVTVTGSGVISATVFDPFVIEFRDFLAGNDVALTATGATVLAITRNGAGTTVNANTALELDGNLNLGDEFVTFIGVGALPLTGTGAGFTGALRAINGNSVLGTGKTPIQTGGGNGQVNYIGAETGASLILNGSVFQPAALPAGQFTNINKVGSGTLEYAGTTANFYGTTGILNGSLRLNKAPGVNAIPFIFGAGSSVTVGDNVGAANSDQLVLVQAEQIPDGSPINIMGTGQMIATAAQAASVSNEVQQVFIPNVAPTGQFRLQFNGVSTIDIPFGSTLGFIQSALNAISTIGGVGGSVVVQGSGSGANQLFTVTFLGTLAGTNVAELKVMAGTTAFGAVTPAITTLTTGGVAGHETIGTTVLRVATQGAGNISLQPASKLGLQGDLTVDTYGALTTAAAGAAISGGTVELRQQSANGASANRSFTVADVPVGDDLRIDSTLVDGALGSLSAFNKTGVGASRLVLGGAGANTFTGTTTVTVGILQIEKGTALGATLPDEVQNYIVNNVVGAATGQYTLTFNAATTAGLDPRATADEVATALNNLATIGGVGGSVTVVPITNGNTGLQYFIRFGGTLAGTDVGQITINTNTLGGGATVGAAATSQGGGLANIAAAQTIVNAGQQLEIDNAGTITNEQLTFSGSGMINETTAPFWNNGLQAAAGTGAVRNIAGNNLWTSTIAGMGNQVMGANPSSVGALPGTTLTFGGLSVLSNNQHLGKTGGGTLELAGSVTNTYTGNTYVNEGTLLLNKSGAAIAINGGEIMLGDNVGGNNADVILYAPGAGTDQIGNRVIRVTSSGLLNLNGVNDTNNNTIVLDVGPTFSGDVQTGAGVLTNNNQFSVVNLANTTTVSVPATISGIYDLAAGTRNVDVREGNAPVELLISAVIQGGANGITKVSRGTLSLTGNNTYTGTTTLNNDSGTLLANTPGTVAASPYTVNSGSILGGNGTINGAVTFVATGGNLTVGGILNPGPNSPVPGNTGILTVNNSVTFNAGARYFADINGTVAGTDYDQLVVGGAGTVTITGNATASILNNSTINGTTGNGFQPVNGVDAFKLISKASAGNITVGLNAFLSEILPQPPAVSPATVTIGGKTYSTSYNIASGLNDGNDFVLQAVPGSRVWDGRIDNNLVNVSNDWTLATNWVGDVAPFVGDDLVFNDVGLANGKNAPFNNYTAGTDFRSINFGNTAGVYTVTGNSVLLNAASGGVNSDNTADVAVTNNLNLPLTTASNPQTITVKDGSTLNFGGTIGLVASGPLTVSNGAGVDANGAAVFNGAINGGGALNVNMIGANGDATFNAAVGGVTPLDSINVTTVDDLTSNSTIATVNNVSQTGGTGTTTLSGGNVGGTLTMTNEAIVLSGSTLTVTGIATLTASASTITDGNGAVNNITAPGLALNAVSGIGSAVDPIDTTITNFEATTATGGVFLSNTGTLSIGNVNGTLSGVDVTGATGNISLVATGSINVSLFNEDVFGPGNITIDAQGAASDVNTGTLGGFGSGSVQTTGAGALLSVTAGRDVNMGTTNALDYGDMYSNGDILINAGRDFNIRQFTFLDVNGTGTNTINAGRDINVINDGTYSRISSNGGLINLTAGRNIVANSGQNVATIDSTRAATTPTGANISLTATTGFISLGDGIDAGTAGNVTLSALASNITDTNINGATRVSASGLTAAAATGVLLETAVTTATSVTVSGAGNVDLRELDAINLATVTAANGDVIVNAGGAITNAASAVISASGNGSFTGSGITLGNQASDALNFGTLTFNSAGAVNVAEDSSTQLGGISAANSLVLSSTGAITNAAAANVTVTTNASLNAPSINLGTAGGDAINFGSLTFVASAGSVTIEENSALDLLGASTATGAINLTSVDVLAAGQNLTIPAGASVQSTGSSVTLNAGDNATIAGNITSFTSTTINIDAGDAESNGTIELVTGSGGSLSITGVITTPAVGLGGGMFINGNDDVDTFNFSPQTTTEIRLNGNAPAAADFPTNFDKLILNVAGTTNPSLTVPGSIAPYNGSGSGAWSFTSAHLPVLFTNIEDNAPIGSYHLIYDNSVAPIANLFVVRDASQTKVQLLNGANNGPLVYQGDLATILSLRVLGSAGNDIVTVDDINTLPSFFGTVPGVTDNPNIPLTAEFMFDGLGGTDTLVFNILGTTASQTYAIGSGSGAAGLEGEIESNAAGVSLLSYFQNVELTQRTGTGPAAGALSILGDLSGNSLAVLPNGGFTRTTATGYTPFEFSGNNFSSLSVSGGQGTDSVELFGYGVGQMNPLPTALNGDANDDTIRVHSTTGNTGVVTLNGGAGNDQFLLGNLGNTVDNIVGQVIVDGTDGNVGGNTDTLSIVDTGDTGPDTVFVNTVNPFVSADYRVEGITSTGGDDVILRNVDVLNYTGTQGDDLIDARFESTTPVHDLNTVSLSGWLGGDRFLLFTSDQVGGTGLGVTPTGLPSGVANISLFGDAPGNPNAGDGSDIFGETPAGLVGTGIMNVGLVVPNTTRMIRPSVSTSIAIDGGQPTGALPPTADSTGDVHNLDISAFSNAVPVVVSTFSPGTVVVPGIQPLTWTQIEDINLVDQGKLTNLQMGDLFARTTAGSDLVQLTRNPTLLNPNQVRLRISASIANYSVSGKTLIYGGDSNDNITQSNLTVPAEFYGEGGDDVLSGAMNNDWLVGGLGNDRINASGGDNVVWGDNAPTNPGDLTPQDSAIGGNDILSGLGGNDVFYGGAGDDQVSAGGGNDYVSGGLGNDTLDGNDGDDRIYGGSGNDVIGGHAGNDLLSGGDNNDRLFGGTGNDVIFGGTGADELTGGDGNDLLVTGSVLNENSTWTSVASVSNYSPATYTNGSDNDAALLTLLTQWGSSSDRSSIAAITHDLADDDVFGGLGDDDFCWESVVDLADDFPAVAPADFNAFGMGTDERFGPT